jgi:6-phosphogluconolactonase (cycloisomerase 2 family)
MSYDRIGTTRARRLFVALVATVFATGCPGKKTYYIGGSAVTAGPAITIIDPGYAPVGPAIVVTQAESNTGAMEAVTYSTGALPPGRAISDIIVLERDDTTGAITVITNIVFNLAGSSITFTPPSPGTYQAAVPGVPSATLSSISVNPSEVAANGTSLATITVTVIDTNGAPLPNQTVSLAVSGTGNTLTQPANPTNLIGQASATLASTVAGTKTITVTIDPTVNSPTVLPTATVTFGASAPNVSNSYVLVEPGTGVLANGNATATISILLRDQDDVPVTGASCSVSASGFLNVIPQPAPTNAAGFASTTIASTAAQTETITVSVGGVTLTSQPTVQFVALARNVYVANPLSFNVDLFAASTAAVASAQLIPLGNVAAPALNSTQDQVGPMGVAVDPLDRWVYMATSNGVVAYAVGGPGATSQLTLVDSNDPNGNPSADNGNSYFDVVAEPTGRWVYGAISGSNVITQFTVPEGTPTSNAIMTVLQTTNVYPASGYQNASGSNLSSIALHPSGQWLYASVNDEGGSSPSLVAFTIDPGSGNLTKLGSTISFGESKSSSPGYIAVDPLGRYVVAIDSVGESIYVYAVQATTGLLTEADEIDGIFPNNPGKPAVHPTGSFIYVPVTGSPGSIMTFAVNTALPLDATISTTTPTTTSLPSGTTSYGVEDTQTIGSSPLPSIMAVDPTGSFLSITTNGASSEVLTYAIGASGALSSNPTSVRAQGNGAGDGGPVGIAYSIGVSSVSFGSQYVYVANESTSPSTPVDNVTAFTVAAGVGTLTSSSTAVTPSSGSSPGWTSIALDPLGRFAFVGESVNEDVASFTILSGALELTGQSTASSEPVDSVGVDPNGQFVFTGGGSGTLTCFPIGTQGALLNSTTASVGTSPVVGVDPAGLSVFGLSDSGGAYGAFYYPGGTLGGATGPNASGTVSGGGTLTGIAIPAASRFAYVTDLANVTVTTGTVDALVATPAISIVAPTGPTGQIDVFQIDPATGALDFIGADQVTAGAGGLDAPVGIVADPFGQFVYVLNGNNTITGFQIGTVIASTGATSPPDGSLTLFSAFSAGAFSISGAADANAIAIDAGGQFLWVTDSTNLTVTPFAINRTTGALTQGTASSTGNSGTAPAAIAVLGVPK